MRCFRPVLLLVGIGLLAAFAIESRDDDYEANEILHVRQKRAVTAILSVFSNFDFYKTLISAGSFVYGIVNGQQQLAELKSINKQMKELNTRVENIENAVGRLELGQKFLQAVVEYSKCVAKLEFIRHKLVTQLTVDETTGALVPENVRNDWLDQVFDSTKSLEQALFDIHRMVIGKSPVFFTQSLVTVFRQHIAANTQQQSQKFLVQEFAQLLAGLQLSGYAAYFTALNARGRNSEIAAAKIEMNSRFVAQEPVFKREIEAANNYFSNPTPKPWKMGPPNTRGVDRTALRTSGYIAGCQFYQKSTSRLKGPRVAMQCDRMQFTGKAPVKTPSGTFPITPSTYVAQNEPRDDGIFTVGEVSIGRDLHIRVIDRIIESEVCVDNRQTEAICGVQLVQVPYRSDDKQLIAGLKTATLYTAIGLRVRICPRIGAPHGWDGKDIAGWSRWKGPTYGGLQSLKAFSYVNLNRVTPRKGGWVVCMKLKEEGAAGVSIHLRTVLE